MVRPLVAPPRAKPENFAAHLCLGSTLSGDPLLAFVAYDLDQDGDFSDSTLFVAPYDPSTLDWAEPIPVALVGDTRGPVERKQVSLALDASTHTLGVAYANHGPDGDHVFLALSSDGGKTWQTNRISSDEPSAHADRPALALINGTVQLVYVEDGALFYVHGRADEIAAWPTPKRLAENLLRDVPPGIAVDSEGHVGIAWSTGDGVFFTRPDGATATPVRALSKGARGSSVAFLGQTPIVVGVREQRIWIARAESATGDRWREPIAVPDDDSGVEGLPQLVVRTRPTANGVENDFEVIFDSPRSGSCGRPKRARSSDLTSWQTCGPANKYESPLKPSSSTLYPSANEIWIATRTEATGPWPTSVVLWRLKE
jgi:hypothetical protein